jgi:transcriptional regulator with XRE-family HTH domain
MNLGKKIRRMRQVRGLTTVALAKHARVTPGFISQLEYSQTVPSLQTLQRVAAALDVSLTYFLLEESRQPQVVRKQQRQMIHLGHDGSRLWLLSPLPPQHLELALLELPPGAVSWSTAHSHEGQQCHLVLQGTVRADYEDHTYHLETGDSILWDATMPYRLENIGNNDVQILIAMAPASLWKHGGEEASNGTLMPAQVDGRLSPTLH